MMHEDTESGIGAAAEKVENVYRAKDDAELAEAYDDWANEYSNDLRRLGYRLPGVVGAMFARYVPEDATPILDAGAGSGLLGEELNLLGYGGIVGIDLSEQMLAAALRTGSYEAVHQMRLGGPLDFPANHFAAIGSIGTFTNGHAGPESFDELIRVMQPGGKIITSIRVDDGNGEQFFKRFEQLDADGALREITRTARFSAMPIGEAHVKSEVVVLEVL